jgi:FixJ family two-component response regulator
LVVDDDPGMLRGVKRLLREYGYDSVLFASAEAFQNQNDFEKALCVILDINLNGGSGIELRHRLKAAGISVPVIYITGNDSPAVRNGCASIWMPRLSHKAVLGAVADRAARESIGGLT